MPDDSPVSSLSAMKASKKGSLLSSDSRTERCDDFPPTEIPVTRQMTTTRATPDVTSEARRRVLNLEILDSIESFWPPGNAEAAVFLAMIVSTGVQFTQITLHFSSGP